MRNAGDGWYVNADHAQLRHLLMDVGRRFCTETRAMVGEARRLIFAPILHAKANDQRVCLRAVLQIRRHVLRLDHRIIRQAAHVQHQKIAVDQILRLEFADADAILKHVAGRIQMGTRVIVNLQEHDVRAGLADGHELRQAGFRNSRRPGSLFAHGVRKPTDCHAFASSQILSHSRCITECRAGPSLLLSRC